MKIKKTMTLLLFLVVTIPWFSFTAWAKIDLTTLSGQDSVQTTIYNSADLTLDDIRDPQPDMLLAFLLDPRTGIGLYLVQHLAHAHGGSVWLDDTEVGVGSTFSLRLPKNPEGELEAMASTSE